jgi:hypothetical protein
MCSVNLRQYPSKELRIWRTARLHRLRALRRPQRERRAPARRGRRAESVKF